VAAPDATASIINGSPTSISAWPWQVAVSYSTSEKPGASPWHRTFCGGSIVAPSIVLTASHCALEMVGQPASDFSVIAGRTNLNSVTAGQEVRATKVVFPRNDKGKIRYLIQDGWDVALLVLSQPLDEAPIQLLGPDEDAAVAPGMRLIETGWGTTITGRFYSPKSLKVGGTNIQPGSICRGLLGARYFNDSLQICLGDANGYQANCYGDSGGPAVAVTTSGYRQVGLTSSGTAANCAGTIPNVDVLVGGHPLRSWIQSEVLKRSGIDPVGSGAGLAAGSSFCRIPFVKGLSVRQATRHLVDRGCSATKVKRRGRGNRVIRQPAPSGWFWSRATPIRLVVGGR
jgi:hypothetical protein